MSELTTQTCRKTLHWQLLGTASAFALLTSTFTEANADERDTPAIWIELGGQFDFMSSPGETWIPSNLPPVIDHPVTGILNKRPRIGYDTEGKLTVQPGITDWTFSVGIRYGKAKREPKFAHDQTYQTRPGNEKYVPTTYAFTDLHSVEETQHFILDFQAGKDVGLGIVGETGSSTLNFGIRLAQFREKADTNMTAQINVPHKYSNGTNLSAYMHEARSFHGIGPSIAWNGSLPILGSLSDGLAADWGINGAVLFGRQKTRIKRHTEEDAFAGISYVTPTPLVIFTQRTHLTHSSYRSRNVIVPNIGAFAGISYRLGGRGKIALGYRADFFFGAMDSGIDLRHSEDIGFHGPFATISLGLGG